MNGAGAITPKNNFLRRCSAMGGLQLVFAAISRYDLRDFRLLVY
jgi:hypothetical protein